MSIQIGSLVLENGGRVCLVHNIVKGVLVLVTYKRDKVLWRRERDVFEIQDDKTLSKLLNREREQLERNS